MTIVSTTTSLLRAFRSELAKLRHARVILSTLLVPAAFVTLKSVAFAVRGEEGFGAERFTFDFLFSIGQFFWESLLIPLFAVTICTWLVWLEDDSGHWKVILAQPTPRGAVYLSKLILACFLLVLIQSCWWLFHVAGGLAVDLNGREAIGAVGQHAVRVALALTPLVGVQLLLSMLLRSPFTALGIGVVGNTAALVLGGTAINYWHPWGLAQLAGQPASAPWVIGVALATAVGLSWVGVVRFGRKEI
jgi:hypothetical protein